MLFEELCRDVFKGMFDSIKFVDWSWGIWSRLLGTLWVIKFELGMGVAP